MNLKFFGASASALLLATALAGCGGPGGNGTTPGGSSGGDTIATVGSGSVTRTELDQALEGAYGEQSLPTLIDNHLLAEELKAKNLTVSDEEVTAELTRLQDQNPDLKTIIDAGGPRLDLIKNQMKRNLTVQKLLTQGITGDEAKEKAFLNTYASYYTTPTQNKLGLLAATTKVRADQLVRDLKTKSFEAVVEDQKSKAATDPIAAQSTADVGRFETPDEFATSRGIPPTIVAPLIKALATAKKGQVLPVQAITAKGPYLIVKVIDRKEATKPDFAKLHDQVETDYKMSQAALAEIKKNPTNPQKLEDNIKQSAQYLSQPNPQTGAPGARPSMRDILTFILTPASNSILDKLRTAGTVQISDTTYKDVAKRYQPVASATGGAAAGNTATANSAAENTAAANTAATNSAAPAKP